MDLIPGAHTVHRRISWQDPKWPVIGPVDDPSNNTTLVVHYTAADDLIDGDPGEHAEDLPQYFRNMQYAYAKPKALGGRGYSLGYCWGVDWLGGIWQIRGWEFQSAANAAHNFYTVPVLVLVDGDDEATPEAVASIRLIRQEAERRAGRPLVVKGHGQLYIETGEGTATACPGRGLQGQVDRGVFYDPPAPERPIPPVQEDDDMEAIFFPVPDPTHGQFFDADTPHLVIWPSGRVSRATNAHYALAQLKNVPVIPLNSKDQYLDLVAQIGK